MEEQIQVSDTEVRLEVEKDLRSWNLDYLKFAPETFSIPTPTEQDVEQYAKADKKSVEAFYAKNKNTRFVRGREVEYRRLLIKKPDEKAPNYEEALKTAREKIEKLHKRHGGRRRFRSACDRAFGRSGRQRLGSSRGSVHKEVFESLKVGTVCNSG